MMQLFRMDMLICAYVCTCLWYKYIHAHVLTYMHVTNKYYIFLSLIENTWNLSVCWRRILETLNGSSRTMELWWTGGGAMMAEMGLVGRLMWNAAVAAAWRCWCSWLKWWWPDARRCCSCSSCSSWCPWAVASLASVGISPIPTCAHTPHASITAHSFHFVPHLQLNPFSLVTGLFPILLFTRDQGDQNML